MISNKTAAALLFITLTMKADASKSTQEPSSSGKLVFKKQKHASKGKNTDLVLHDTSSAVEAVDAIVKSTETMSISQGQPVPQVNEFEELIKEKNYERIFELGEKMNIDDFLKQLSSVVKSLEQYEELARHLINRKLVAKFYLYGDVGVIKAALIESRVYAGYKGYADYGYLENALLLTFKEDRHDRTIELLKMRQELTVERDKRIKQDGYATSFESFMEGLLSDLAPKKDDMPLRRFLASRGEELRGKHPDILDTLCQKLMSDVKIWAHVPKTKKLITDLIGYPHLLTPVAFAKGFLCDAINEFYSSFIEYAWDETIREVLTNKDVDGGERLWQMMKEGRPDDFVGAFPSTTEALTAVTGKFPTKQKLEADWYKGKVTILFDSINGLESIILLPDELWSIVFGYIISLTFTEVPATTKK